MRLKANKSRSPIGLDLGSRRVHAVQLTRLPRGWKLACCASMPHFGLETLTDPQAVARLRGSLMRQGFTGKRIVMSVPRPSLVASTVDIPAQAQGIPVHEIAHVELARRAGCDPNAITSAAWRLPGRGTESGTQAMGVACRNEDTDAFIDPFEAEKSHVEAVDYEGGAMLRACRLITGTGRGLVAAVNLDWSSALLVLGFQQTVVYQRVLPELGLERVEEALKEQNGIDDELASYVIGRLGFKTDSNSSQASGAVAADGRRLLGTYVKSIADEISTSFQYAQHAFADQQGDPRVLFMGAGAAVPGLGDVAKSAVGFDTRVVTPGDLVSWSGDMETGACDPAMVTALGLAQYFGEDQ